MNRGVWKYLATAMLAGIIGASCSVTRRVPEGSYLLVRNKVVADADAPRNERIPVSDMEKYIRQSPNKRLLGTNFYLWAYNLANPEKHNWWNNFKRRIGEEPVIWDSTQMRISVDNIKTYMDSRGYFDSSETFEVDTSRRKARITYTAHQGRPYRIESIRYNFRDKFLSNIILADTSQSLLRTGDIFDITELDRERVRITEYLKNRGYYNFAVSNITFRADTSAADYSVDLTMIVRRNLAGYDEKGDPEYENHKIYRIKSIYLYPNYDPTLSVQGEDFRLTLDTMQYRGLNIVYNRTPKFRHLNVRRRILRRMVDRLDPNDVYSAAEVQATYDAIMRLGYFKNARIVFEEDTSAPDEGNLLTFVGGAEPDAADNTIETAAAGAPESTREGYLLCNILCTPALRQSYKVELEGSATSSFYAVKATLGYQNRNLFRGAELFDISLSGGYEFFKAGGKKPAFEIGGAAGLSFSRFITPFSRLNRTTKAVNPGTKFELSVNSLRRPFYRRVLSGVSLNYTWGDGRFSNFSLRPVDISIVKLRDVDQEFIESLKNPYLQESYRNSLLIAGISGSYVYNNQVRNLDGNAQTLRINWETRGNLIDGLEHLLRRPSPTGYYNLFGIRYSQYVRADASLSNKFVIGTSSSIVHRIYVGAGFAYGNTKSLPFDRFFYAGGSNGMRGWVVRSLGPGNVEYTRVKGEYPMQVGNLKLETNLEVRFPLWSVFHGATFFDVGNVWFLRNNESPDPAGVFHFDSFYRQLGFNTGLGLRIDIKYAVVRFDWGIKIHDPNAPAGQRWIHDFRLSNTALNIGVGYPF